MASNARQFYEEYVNRTVDQILERRAQYPFQVRVEQPSKPWEDEHWVSKRDTLADQLSTWLHCNGYTAPRHYCPWFEKGDHMIVFGFKDPKIAVLFKLVHGGARV